MSNQIRVRRGTKAELPTLALGELGLTTDEGSLYVGGSLGNIQQATKTELLEVSNKVDGDLIIIGDSYGDSPDQDNSFLKYLKAYAHIPDSYTAFISGGSFGGGVKYLSALQSLFSSITNKNKIKEVLICGGYNDIPYATSPISTDILNGIGDVVSYVKTNYPNAKLSLAMISLCKVDAYRATLFTNVVANYKNACEVHDIVNYVENSHKIFHRYDQLGVDGIHPTNFGSETIARGLAGYISNGTVTYALPVELNTTIIASGANSGANITMLERDTGDSIHITCFGFSAVLPSGDYSEYTEIGTLSDYNVRGSYGDYCVIPLTFSTDIGIIPGSVLFKEGKLYVKLATVSPVTSIYITAFAQNLDKHFC